jgi:hypothetical protein
LHERRARQSQADSDEHLLDVAPVKGADQHQFDHDRKHGADTDPDQR